MDTRSQEQIRKMFVGCENWPVSYSTGIRLPIKLNPTCFYSEPVSVGVVTKNWGWCEIELKLTDPERKQTGRWLIVMRISSGDTALYSTIPLRGPRTVVVVNTASEIGLAEYEPLPIRGTTLYLTMPTSGFNPKGLLFVQSNNTNPVWCSLAGWKKWLVLHKV